MSKFNFENKVVWVTGASSGIGASLAEKLNEQGAMVILSARRIEKLEQLRNKLKFPEKSMIVTLDLTDPESIQSAVDKVNKLDHLDLLIQDAGIAQKGLVKDNPIEIDRTIMETNYFGTITLTKAILPRFLDQKHGWIAVVTSIAGVVGVPGRSSYSASKHALHGFFESLRAELIDCDLDISIIMPGFINTQITVKELKSDGHPYGKVEKSHKMGLSPDECAEKIIRKLKKRKKNIIVGGFEVTSIYLQRFLPGLYDFLIRHHPMRKWRRFTSILRIKKV